MPTDGATNADQPSLERESDLLRGVRSAISNARGSLDQSAIDEVLGIRQQDAGRYRSDADSASGDPTG